MKEPAAGRFWPWAIAALMLLILTIALAVLRAATGDGGAAVIEDYYQQAVDWDAGQADLAASRALGWSAELSFREVPQGMASAAGKNPPNTLVFVALADREGRPLEGATVTLAGAFRGHSQRIWSAVALPLEGGYGAAFRLGPPGLWDWRITAERDTARFLHSETRELGRAR
jgi:hypothetical protein